MPWLMSQREHRKAPAGATRLRSSHPFYKNARLLQMCQFGLLMRAVVPGTFNNNSFGIDGLSIRQTVAGSFIKAAGGGYSSRVACNINFAANRVGIFCVFHKSLTASGELFYVSGASGQDDGTAQLNADGTVTITANGDVSIASTDAAVDGVNTLFFINDRPGSSQRMFLNGVAQASTGASSSQQGFGIDKIVTGELTSGDLSIGMAGVLAGIPSDPLIVNWSKNPWQIFEPEIVPLWVVSSGSPPQLLSPTGHLAGSTWIASNGGALYTCVDETVPDEADYTYTTTSGAWEEFTFPTPDAQHNGSANGGHVRYRIPAGSGAVTVELRQGASVLQTWGPHTLTGSLQAFDQTITTSTSDSSDLRVRFTAS